MTSQLYLVINGTREQYVAERNLSDMTRERTISDLAAGEWGDINGDRFMVSSIIEIDSGADRTQEFIDAALLLMEADRPPSAAYARDHALDLRKHAEAAE